MKSKNICLSPGSSVEVSVTDIPENIGVIGIPERIAGVLSLVDIARSPKVGDFIYIPEIQHLYQYHDGVRKYFDVGVGRGKIVKVSKILTQTIVTGEPTSNLYYQYRYNISFCIQEIPNYEFAWDDELLKDQDRVRLLCKDISFQAFQKKYRGNTDDNW